MREYATPLAERQRIAAYYRERYKRDPDYRLRKTNCLRIRQGLPPRTHLHDLMTSDDIVRAARERAARRSRAANGRYLKEDL